MYVHRRAGAVGWSVRPASRWLGVRIRTTTDLHICKSLKQVVTTLPAKRSILHGESQVLGFDHNKRMPQHRSMSENFSRRKIPNKHIRAVHVPMRYYLIIMVVFFSFFLHYYEFRFFHFY